MPPDGYVAQPPPCFAARRQSGRTIPPAALLRRGRCGGSQAEHNQYAAFRGGIDDALADLTEERGWTFDAAGHHGEILLTIRHVGDRALQDAGANVERP